MKSWKVTIATPDIVKESEQTAATLQAALGKALRDAITFGVKDDLGAITLEYERMAAARAKLTQAEKLARKIARDQAKLAALQE